MGKFLFLRFFAGLMLVGLSFGCGGSGSSVSGTVTFNGQPVESGNINFIPADGKGAPVGGEIKGGKYTVRNVTPGKNKVVVTAYSSGEGTSSMDAGIQAAKSGKHEGVAANSEGNSQVHDISSGSSELNLTLRTMSSSAPPAKK
ncbi:MAG: hypothetical protein J0I06_24375 [Planctomycetes bacterium]|nr:hypothetical protein [Planctomycetota bacterium]